jgi:sugar phosphate isomerase/epimerase
LGIDPARAAREYGHKIFYAHAKDTEINSEQLYHRGIMDLVEGGWRRSCLPGLGGIDFEAFLGALREGGYDGPISVELEDRDWLASRQQVQEGMVSAMEYLKPLVSENL